MRKLLSEENTRKITH